MAIQVNAEIETVNKGIITTGYVKIEMYRFDKFLGKLYIVSQMYNGKTDADNNKFVYLEDHVDPLDRAPQSGPTHPLVIYNGNQIELPMITEFDLATPETVTVPVYENQTTTNTITYMDFDENGNVVQKTREETVTTQVQTGTQDVTKNKIDITIIGTDPYGYAYGKLKGVYSSIFGAENISDC